MNLNNAKQMLGNASLIFKKHSPELLIAGGVIGFIGTTIVACKATMQLEDTMVDVKTDIQKVKAEEDNPEVDYKKELTMAYCKGGLKVLRLYAPAIALGTASISAVLGGHSILRKRNIAISAAYAAVEDGFSKYRERVISEFGEEVDRRMKFGGNVEEVEVTEVDEKTGKEKKKKVKGENIQRADCSDYAKFFDEGSIHWTKDADSNLFFLRKAERFANETLQAKGHIFLNEVYDMLDIPRTKAGAVVGWKLGNGDDYVDFGLYNSEKERVRRFVNGEEAVILLDFNVDGVIYDLI